MSAKGTSLWDVVVVGAGPAGSAAALSARTADPNARVLVLDKQPAGRDKVCGDGVGPDVVDVFHELGIAHVVHMGEEVTDFRVSVSDGPTLTGVPPRPGFVIPRAELDHRLLQSAIEVGAEFQCDAVVDVLQDSNCATVRTRSGEVHTSRFVIAADGAYSSIRRGLGIPANTGKHMAIAIRGYTRDASAVKELRIIWDEQSPGLAYAWAFPLANGQANVGYGMSLSAGPVTRASLIERFHHLLPSIDVNSVEFRGHQLPLATNRPTLAHGRVMLTGDAASLVNPLSGEGILYALISGKEAGSAAASHQSVRQADKAYKEGMSKILGKHHRQVSLLAAIARPYTVRLAIESARRNQRSTDVILGLALGTGTITLKDFTAFATDSLRNTIKRTPVK